jgi:hypothetical protein
MAFCNSCGTSIAPGTRFCSKCGAPILASTLPPSPVAAANVPATPAVPVPPAPAQGSGALKVILIVVGVVVLLGALGIASLAFFSYQIARHAHVHHEGNNVKVDTPFGSVEATKDPAATARNLGVDLYPGAEISSNGAQSATFGDIHTATLNSESTDSVDKVSGFYKSKFPNAMVTSSSAGHCTIVSNDHRSMITINIEAEGDKTKIRITNVTHKSDDSNSSPN